MPTDTPTAPGLPPLCFTRLPSTGETIAILRGEAGYHPIVTFLTPEQLNAALLVPPTADHVQAMLAGSLFGWHVPAANPVHYACAKHDGGSGAAMTPLPQYPVVADWGGPSTAFQLAGKSPIERRSAPDRLWDYAGEHCGFYGYLRVANARIVRRTGIELLDLSDRQWRAAYEDRVHPCAAADDAIEYEAPGMGRDP